MRELLKEAAEVLRMVQTYFPSVEQMEAHTHDGLAVADVDACQKLAARIDAALAEPLDSAIEDLIDEIRDNDHMPDTDSGDFNFTLSYKEAAALIEGYGRRVPRAFVKDVTPDPLALLKRCKTALQNALNDYGMLNARNELLPPLEQVHPFTLGPAEIQSVLSDIEKMEE